MALQRLHLLLFFAFLSIIICTPAAAQEVRVVVSIKPVHAIVAGVLDGVATPELLLTGGESPHSYALRPSQAKLLASADLFFWVGPELENFLVKPLQTLAGKGRVVTLLEAEGLLHRHARSGGLWASDDHGHDHGHRHQDKKKQAQKDPHLWLDPQNAKAIARLALTELRPFFPEQQEKMAANVAALEERIDALDRELAELLAPVRQQPFIVFHDAYQYFEARYQLNAAGSITLNPEQAPGARQIRKVRKIIEERQVVCVFAEPQFEPRLVATVVEGSGARQGVLDPEGGADLAAGPAAYFELMRRLGQNLRGCLEEGN
jgi:zinc transport system substrate-binding protein